MHSHYRVLFEGRGAEHVESTFPALAARIVAERLGLSGDSVCAVVDESDGSVTQWRVSKLEGWYARPLDGTLS